MVNCAPRMRTKVAPRPRSSVSAAATSPVDASRLRLPAAPSSIQKGSTLKTLLDHEAIECLAANLKLAHPHFNDAAFVRAALAGIGSLGILQRGHCLAQQLHEHLPPNYEDAVAV